MVGFQGEPDKFGNPVWDVFVSEPEPKDGAATAPRAPQQRQERTSAANAGVDGDFDEMPW